MRVAIIEQNKETQTEIRRSLKGRRRSKGGVEPSWEIDFYIDPENFFNKNSSEYDIVMVDYETGTEKYCFDFIHRIYDRTDAELCILTSTTDSKTLGNLLKDEHINCILDKNDLDIIVEHLEYSSSRCKIKNHLMNESAIYSEVANEMF